MRGGQQGDDWAYRRDSGGRGRGGGYDGGATVVDAREDLVGLGVAHSACGTDRGRRVDVTELFTFYGLLSVSLAFLSLV